jgi:hypothetical protein
MELFDTMKTALDKATQELNHASHLSETGANAGIRKMNANKADWLSWVVYLAEHGLDAIKEDERLAAEQKLVEEENVGSICDQCPVSTETSKLLALKDDIIQGLQTEEDKLKDQLKSLQVTYDCEVEYRQTLIDREKLDYLTKIVEEIHDCCWLDGTVLVAPVEYLDKALLALIEGDYGTNKR